MTVAIKGMDMPKNAKTCRFRHSIFNYCVIDKNRDTIKTDKFDKCLNCPLIDLPEENKDMSWEELIKALILIAKDYKLIRKDCIYINGLYYVDREGEISVGIEEDNMYLMNFDKQLKPFEMYQIIKALIGDER